VDLKWYGFDLDDPRWGDPELRTIAYLLDGAEAAGGGGDYLLFVILNAGWHHVTVRLPEPGGVRKWRRVVDTSVASDTLRDDGVPLAPADHYLTSPRSSVVLLARA
jgi:pullulanase/glycogen debranching enzyme